MLDVGVDCTRVEGVGAEVAGLEDAARAGYCAVIRVADEGDVDVLGGLEKG
jgi:hypothetical protein